MEQNAQKGIFTTDVSVLDGMISRHPWFTSARIVRSAINGQSDEMLSLGLQTKAWPAALLHDYEYFESLSIAGPYNQPHTETDDIIERFLASGDKRIIPDESTPLNDASEDSTVFTPDEDMDTEELQRIYREQGLDRMADEVSELVEDTMEETY